MSKIETLPSFGSGEIRTMSIQQALVWTFRRECARLVTPGEIEREDMRPDVSTVWIMIQRGAVGCKVDGGGRSDPHEDAEAIAGVVSTLPEHLGGFRMATTIAELARADMEPDWLVGAKARCVPMFPTRNAYGVHAKVETRETISYKARGRTYKRKVEFCRVTYSPSPAFIASQRRRYAEWRNALEELAAVLRSVQVLRRIRINDQLPPAEPWNRRA